MSDQFSEPRTASITFSQTPGQVKMTIGDNDLQMFLTPEQALDHAAKLAGFAYRARGENISHVAIIPA